MLRGLFYNLWPFCIWPYCDISINYQLKKNVLIQINLGIYSFMYTLLKWCECLWSFERDHPWKWQSQSYFDFLQGGFKTITHDGYTRTAKKLLQILLNMIKQQQQHQQKRPVDMYIWLVKSVRSFATVFKIVLPVTLRSVMLTHFSYLNVLSVRTNYFHVQKKNVNKKEQTEKFRKAVQLEKVANGWMD